MTRLRRKADVDGGARLIHTVRGRARELGGTGLGLASAKWAVEANGGTIALESVYAGSVFRISLPREGVAT
jgi:signal transduction histidine kinase